MTISKTGARRQHAGDGGTTAFSFPYRFFDDSDLNVYLLDASGTQTLLTLTTHYSVSNNGDETGGTVTMVTPPASGETLTILRDIPPTQETDYQPNDAFPPMTHEAALDRLTLLVQQLQEKIGRAIVAQESDSASLELPADRASSYLFFDASKNPTASPGVADVSISTAMTPVVQAASLGAGMTAFGISAFAQTLLDDADAATARTTLGAQASDADLTDLATNGFATAANYRAAAADKTLKADIVWDSLAEVELTDAANISWDMSAGINFKVTLGGNRTLDLPSNVKAGQSGTIRVIQDGTGSRTLTLASGLKPAWGVAPVMDTTAAAEDFLTYYAVSSSHINITHARFS